MSCLTTDVLARLEAGLLDERAAAQAFAHLGGCPACQEFHREFFATAHALATIPEEVLEAKPRADSWARIQQRLAEPGPTSELPLAPGSVAIACTYCKDKLARRESVYCAGCLAPHHGGCWEEHGRCASCAVGELVRAESATKPREKAPGRRRTLGGLLLLGAVGVSGAAAFTAGRGSRPASVAVAPTASGSFQVTTPHPVSLERIVESEAARSAVPLTSHEQAVAILARPSEASPAELEWVVADVGAALARGEKPAATTLDWLYEQTSRWHSSSSEGDTQLRAKVAALVLEVVPGDADTWYRRGLVLSGCGQAKEALESFDRALVLRPDFPEAREGRVELRLGVRGGESLRAWTPFYEYPFKADPGAARRRPDPEAEADLGLLIEHGPPDRPQTAARACELRATLEAERGDVAAAVLDLERALGLVGEDPREKCDVLERLAWVKATHGDLAGERAAIDRAVALAPGSSRFHHIRAQLERQAGELAAAIADERTAVVHAAKGEGEYDVALADLLDRSFDESGAIALLDSATEGGRAGPTSGFELVGEILARRADRIRVLDEVTRRNPGATLGDLVAEAGAERARREHAATTALSKDSLGLVRLLVAKKDVAEAKKLLAEHHADPSTAALCLAGEIALLEKDWELAAARFESVLAIDSRSACATAGLATAFHNRGATREARSVFEKARGLEATLGHETDAAYFWTVGLEHSREAVRLLDADELDKAVRAFTRVLGENPHHALAHLERARLFRAFRSWDLALEEAQAAVEADPYFPEGHELLGLLEARELPSAPDPRTQRPRALRDSHAGELELQRAVALGAVLADGHAPRATLEQLEASLPRGIDTADVTTGAWPREVPRALRILGAVGETIDRMARRSPLEEQGRPLSAEEEDAFAREALDRARHAIAVATRRAALGERARAGARGLLEQARTLAPEDALDRLDRALLLEPASAELLLERAGVLGRLGHGLAAARDLAAALHESGDPEASASGLLEALDQAALLERDPAFARALESGLEGSASSGPFSPEVRLARAFLAVARARAGDRAQLEAGRARVASLTPDEPRQGELALVLELRALALASSSEERAAALEKASALSCGGFFGALEDGALAQAPGLEAAARDKLLAEAADLLAASVRSLAAWQHVQDEPELASLRDDPRVVAWVARLGASAHHPPARLLRLGAGPTLLGDGAIVGHAWRGELSPGAPGEPPLERLSAEHSSPLGAPLETLTRDAAFFSDPKKVPETVAELAAYDVVFLGTKERPLSSPARLEELAKAVEGGLGLVVQVTTPGRLHALEASPLGRVLPVVSGDVATVSSFSGCLVATPEAEVTGALWSWPAWRSGGQRVFTNADLVVAQVRPGASALLVDAAMQPLLVLGRAGAGRVLVVLSSDAVEEWLLRDLVASVARPR